MIKAKRFLCALVLSFAGITIFAQPFTYEGSVTYNSYQGLVMAGYQGWFNCPEDGANREWYHYRGRDGFHPGSTNVDLWPDVSEYNKVYRTPFTFEDGAPAYLPSPHDSSTVDTHFRWMQEYGLDGVFMQRFVGEVSNPSGLAHFTHVLDHAMHAANKYGRAIGVMYDLSGMVPQQKDVLVNDIAMLAKRYNIFDHSKNPSYLYHNGKPLVTVWGIGFNDHRRYGLDEAEYIIDALKKMGFSVMIGVPTHWRKLENDTENDARLHAVIKKCDVVMPWFVGRYDEKSYPMFKKLIKEDLKWTTKYKVDYAPLCYPGFSWHNMHYPRVPAVTVPRNKGKFLQMQIDNVLASGAKMIYIAMFDEIDEGTAIFKLAHKVPVATPGSTFVPLEDGVENDLYLKIVGQASRDLKKSLGMPERQIRVSCVGASITEGYGTSDWRTKSYPGQIQTALGSGYHVENYGRGGCTMLRKGDCPYVTHEKYQPSLQSNPDIVIIDLGGNDAKLRNRIHKDEFVKDACDLVKTYQSLPSRPRVILLTAMPGFTNDSTEIWDTAIVRDINPLIVQAGKEADVEVIDMHPLLEGRGDLVPDKIHPNDEGAGILGRHIAKYLLDNRKKAKRGK